MNQLTKLDNAIFNWIAKHPQIQQDLTLPRLFKLISKTGDGHLYAFLAFTLLVLETRSGELFFVLSAVAFSIEIPLYIALKRSCKRLRPCDTFTHFNALIQPADKFSLPSGHTAAAFLIATIIAFVYPEFAVFSYLWAGLIGISRIVLKVHFALDVLVGAILGICVANFSIYYFGNF